MLTYKRDTASRVYIYLDGKWFGTAERRTGRISGLIPTSYQYWTLVREVPICGNASTLTELKTKLELALATKATETV